ncbi:hypothetical protein ABT095_22280, partial [Kitasatospora sp. NPDC002227]|uniref:hypothetical protein n=1 Tax=Kitasatospora sp. NPDC002227 TaxID=3154773 RepID=UPI00331D7F31
MTTRRLGRHGRLATERLLGNGLPHRRGLMTGHRLRRRLMPLAPRRLERRRCLADRPALGRGLPDHLRHLTRL